MKIDPDSKFRKKMETHMGQNINNCYQCMKCAAGCPMAEEMDYSPAQIVHAVRLGLKDKVLQSKTIWICASCETCTTRCPQDVDIAGIMDAARNIVFMEGIKVPKEVAEIPMFYEIAVNNIKNFGRLYEMGMITMLKLKTRQFFKDLKLGFEMGRKGKLKLLPERPGNIKEVKRIFEKVRKLERSIK